MNFSHIYTNLFKLVQIFEETAPNMYTLAKKVAPGHTSGIIDNETLLTDDPAMVSDLVM